MSPPLHLFPTLPRARARARKHSRAAAGTVRRVMGIGMGVPCLVSLAAHAHGMRRQDTCCGVRVRMCACDRMRPRARARTRGAHECMRHGTAGGRSLHGRPAQHSSQRRTLHRLHLRRQPVDRLQEQRCTSTTTGCDTPQRELTHRATVPGPWPSPRAPRTRDGPSGGSYAPRRMEHGGNFRMQRGSIMHGPIAQHARRAHTSARVCAELRRTFGALALRGAALAEDGRHLWRMPAAAPSLLTPCSHHFFFACFSFAAKPAYKRPPSGRTTGRQKRRMASGGAGGRQWAKSASPERSGQGLSRTGACRVRAGLRVVQSVLHVWAARGARVP